MKWASLLVCALGSAAVLVTGCDKYMLSADVALPAGAIDAAGNVRVVDGPPPTVAIAFAAMLQGRGFEATVSGAGDDMVVESKTSAGLRFALVLHRVPGENGRDSTRVTMQWMDRSQDSQIHVQIMSDIDKQPGAKK